MILKFCRKTWLCVCLLALSVWPLPGGTVWAQAPDGALYRDLWQTVQARKALLDDPRLGPLNLGVRVTNGIAVLWGPVPSQELSFRAEQRLRAMFELIDIRNGMTIDPGDDAAPIAPPVPEAPRFLPDQLPPRGPLRPAPGQSVALGGIVTGDEAFTARSSPLNGRSFPQAGNSSTTLHMPFLGSILRPR